MRLSTISPEMLAGGVPWFAMYGAFAMGRRVLAVSDCCVTTGCLDRDAHGSMLRGSPRGNLLQCLPKGKHRGRSLCLMTLDICWSSTSSGSIEATGTACAISLPPMPRCGSPTDSKDSLNESSYFARYARSSVPLRAVSVARGPQCCRRRGRHRNLYTLKFNDDVLNVAMTEMTDELAYRRLREGGPSIAWNIGHMLHHRNQIAAAVSCAGPTVDLERYTTTVTDGHDYPPAQQFQAVWTECSTRFVSALSRLSQEALNGPSPIRLPHGERTLLDALRFVVWHEGCVSVRCRCCDRITV
jgi:hypothetical protein